MNSKETINLIEKLIELTQKNVIKWEISNMYPMLSDMEKFDTIFSTDYLGQKIRVYKFFYRHYRDEDEFYWLEEYKLEIFDEQNNTLFNFPIVPNIKDLLNAVMYQNSNVEDFYKNLMS
ncbi:MAG: hypothetical protein AB7E37_07960 [Candidatus Altimarinota bacterium]